jgi:Secretion system C-terminal sorting domain
MKKFSLLFIFLLLGIQSVFADEASSISANFNGTAIQDNGNYIWFNCNFSNLKGAKSYPVIIYFDSSYISFTANSVDYKLTVPNAVITLDPSLTPSTASTYFNTLTNSWIINVPATGSGTDEIFLSGLSFLVPSGGLPGGIKSVTWTGYFGVNQPDTGAAINWKWGAAVYTHFSADYNQLGVLPLHTTDHAGTPENFANKDSCIGGATGGGSSNFTGSWSSTKNVPDIPLPVELSSFTSSVNGRNVSLNWETMTEKNSDKFVIEREAIGANWESIGSVKAAVLSNSPKQYSFTDYKLQSGKYHYRLKMIDNDGSFEYSKVIETEVVVPKNYELSQNFPNPFNPNTVISYSLPLASNVRLIVYNSLGQTVKVLENGYKNAGTYSVNFNVTSLPSGLYFYKLEAGQFTQVKKMILLK